MLRIQLLTYPTISYHVVREAVATSIIEPYWIKSGYNMVGILTKQLSKHEFKEHCAHIFWQPDFHLRHHNRFSEVVDES